MTVEELSVVPSVQTLQTFLVQIDRYKPADCLASSDSLTFDLYQLTDMKEGAVDWSIQLFRKIHIRYK